MPTIRGTQGDDVLNGTIGDDVITDGSGDDIITGGAGNDTIDSDGGSDTIDGGTGDDYIHVSLGVDSASIYLPYVHTTIITAGDGADVVEYERPTPHGVFNIDLGIGNDLLTLVDYAFDGQGTITTGAGADRIVVGATEGEYMRLVDPNPIVVTDFTAGAGGDVIDIGEALEALLFYNPHSANPFASGHLVLVQDGADVIVRVEQFGFDVGFFYDRDLFRLTNVNVADLTAYNLAGYDPNGSAPVHNIVNGTSGSEWLNANVGGSDLNGLGGNDRLTGNIGADNINGGAGDDVLKGGSGNDTLDGGTENDTLDGGTGNDVLRGGDGDDTLTDPSGADTLDGGAGNDTIDIFRPEFTPTQGPVTILGGDGDDFVRFDVHHNNHPGGDLIVDLGAGNDRFVMPGNMDFVQLTLGAGEDHVVCGYQHVPLVITDFTAGNSGDVLELDRLFLSTSITNPFTDGYLLLQQDGADTLVQWDYDGAAGADTAIAVMARLENVDASTLTAFNFGGYAPDGSASSFTLYQGTAGNDHLYGTDADDTINGGDGNDLIEELKSGNDTLNGGNGDDRIVLQHYVPWGGVENVTINGGAGSDTVEIAYSSSGHVVADLGADDDRLIIRALPDSDNVFTLGTGSDVIELLDETSSTGTPAINHTIVITDFQTGNGGDRLDWAQYVQEKNFNGAPDYNPFLEGEARLVQVGADVQLQLSGGGNHQAIPLWTPIVTFQNTTVANFTAYNLGYNLYLPTQAGSGADDILNGTAGADVLYGNGGNDQLNGNDGDDVIWGHDGTDTINGGIGNDFIRGGNDADVIHGDAGADNIDGGWGIDTLDGGDGDDRIADWFGVDAVLGGNGNDNLYVNIAHDSQAPTLGSLNAGDGNDVVEVNNIYGRAGYALDLGAGDDTLIFDRYAFGPVTLGAGRDTIKASPDATVPLVINDFATGDSGDIFDFAYFLSSTSIGYNIGLTGGDPFADGYAQLKQVGTEVRLYLYPAGYNEVQYSQSPAVRFLNTDISQFTSANFGVSDWDPHATPNRVIQLSGDYTNNANRNFVDVTPVAGSGSTGFMFNFGVGATFTNHAKINVTQDGPFGGAATGIWGGPAPAGSTFVNAADGELHVHYDFVSYNGILSSISPVARATVGISTIQNAGVIEVSAASGIAVGISETSLTNSGTFTVTSAYDAYGLQNQDLTGFSNTGTIIVHGDDFAVGLYYSDLRTSGLTNAGTITVSTDPSSPYASIGIYISESVAPSGGVFETFNSGTITADYAYFIENDHTTDLLGTDLLHNSGTMTGDVVLSFGDDTVDNTGTINGSVLLGAGNDHYDGAPGHNFGTVEGGTGNDTITGGSNSDNLYGDAGDDTIYGGLGDDFIEGGLGADTLYGQGGINDFVAYDESLSAVIVDLAAGTATDGIDVDAISQFEGVVGSRFDDNIRGAGAAETLFGGEGNDHVDGAGGADTIRGEAGSDDLTGGSGNDTFLFSIGDGNDIIRDFAAGDHLAIYGYVVAPTITQVGADVLVTLSATDQITLLNTTTAIVQAGLTQSPFPLGNPFLIFDQAIVAANDSLINPAGVTITLNDPADLHYRNLLLPGRGILLASVSDGVGPDFFNAGTFNFVDSGQPLIVGISKHYMYGSDQNNFVNEATGSILIENQGGGAVGVFAITQTFNYGTISVVAVGGDATGFTDLPVAAYTQNYFVNAGVLNIDASGRALGLGQIYGSSSSIDHIFNSGVMTIHGGQASFGLDWIAFAHPADPDRPFVYNSGSIVVTDDTAAKDSAAIRVDWDFDAAMWNSGTLQGDYAIKRGFAFSGAGITGTLSVYNSGQMIGDVDLYGGNGQNVTLINTGTIAGNVKLTNGNDLFDSRSGTFVGTLSGVTGNDTLLTGAGVQTISGGLGDDIISGGAGNDTLTGNQGADHFRYETGFGIDTITDFDAAADHVDVRGYGAWQSAVQQGGDVVVTFAAGEQLVFKNQLLANITPAVFTFGVDAITANTMPAAPVAPNAPAMPLSEATGALTPIYGTAASNTLNGTSANEALSGAAGNDTLNGSGGNDRLDGGTGNDTLNGGTGFDILVGGVGNDTYIVDNVGDSVTEKAGEGIDIVQSSVSFLLGQNLENLTLTGALAIDGIGNEFANTLRGNSGNNSLIGGAGDDYLFGNAGNDALNGGAGYDRLYGGAGDDTYYVNDLTDFAYENAGEGHDSVVSSIDLSLRDNVEDLLLTGVAFIGRGNILDNAVIGNNVANKLYGYEGNDSLDGLGGDDYLFGADGNDTLTGGAGYDRMYGGIGDDAYYVSDTTDFAYENLGEGSDRVISSLVSYQLRANIEELDLAEGSAAVRGYGQNEDNVIVGNSADNFLYGRDGNDIVKGNAGNDILYGENGNDTLFGGAGMDRFYGGAGADKFAFRDGDFAGMTSSTADRIHDFDSTQGDKIHVGGVDANSLLGGDQAFAFIGTAAFSHNAGELRTYQSVGNTYVAGDINGDGIADFVIRVDGLHNLQASDFIL